ncbi:MAG: Lpp/OprI family alanine-zipper lipoprotein, partial [Mariprofundales bacterium]|nr:Lpp/OprI family alanine-zipper lipoprotein [Mariprofundales bacterium]
MKSLTKLGAIILPLALLTACANTAEMDALKASVAAAQSTADEALAKAKNAQSSADAAARAASDAELTALKAQKAAD